MAEAWGDGHARFCSVDTAARLLGISRSSAYNLANDWLDGDHDRGLPCVRLGRRILVPLAVIAHWEAMGQGQALSEPVRTPP